ncbi:uncharacterized protein LOC106013417 isoform X2 [Aplysia californica]|uniref:Uncharacterized protein LOC106013417 isoform X2 n=1 Tax=Aplysia californica TaxID=6500 RepID=A0ABM1W252_APLCA|nr:uncharacterized protein LOC106013417 isoform X2 [Aplysia californica]
MIIQLVVLPTPSLPGQVHVVNGHRQLLLPVKCHWCMQTFVSELIMNMHMSEAHAVPLNQTVAPPGNKSYHHLAPPPPHYMEGMDSDSVTVVLEGMDGEDVFDTHHHHNPHTHRRMLDSREMLETHEAASFIEDLEEQHEETIIYFNNQNRVVSIPAGQHGEMFEEVQLLGESAEELGLQGVDYLETLSNDSIAVAADVVADVMEDMARPGLSTDVMAAMAGTGGTTVVTQVNQTEDILYPVNQLEVDGVMYEFTNSPGPSGGQGSVPQQYEVVAQDNHGGLHGGEETITIDAADIAHLFQQQGLRHSSL